MDVINLKCHAQRVAGRLQISGDDIVGVQLPPGFDRVGGARSRAPGATDNAPDHIIAGGVPRLLTYTLCERVILRIAGHTPERTVGAADATVAAGLPAVKYHAAAAAPTATSSAASAAAAGTSRLRGAGFGVGAVAGLPTSTE